MSSDLLPLPTIIFQTLFLAIAITVESSVLYNRIKLPRKNSVEYATALNLIATFLGWMLFFYIEPILPQALKFKLINYIFFHQLEKFSFTILFVCTFIIFWLTFAIKLIGIFILNKLSDPNYPLRTDRRFMEDVHQRHIRKTKNYPERRQALAILWGHAYSHSIILLILLLKDIIQGF